MTKIRKFALVGSFLKQQQHATIASAKMQPGASLCGHRSKKVHAANPWSHQGSGTSGADIEVVKPEGCATKASFVGGWLGMHQDSHNEGWRPLPSTH